MQYYKFLHPYTGLNAVLKIQGFAYKSSMPCYLHPWGGRGGGAASKGDDFTGCLITHSVFFTLTPVELVLVAE